MTAFKTHRVTSAFNATQINAALAGMILFIASCTVKTGENPGHTYITTWKGDKKAAISITYDDGTINQFKVAKPIMNKLDIKGTFFINTQKVDGSAKGRFIGRAEEQIIKETATIKTNTNNFFERASLIRFTGIDKAVEYHTKAGSLFESGKIKEAFELMDEAYDQVRISGSKRFVSGKKEFKSLDAATWQDFKVYTSEGHEIASHTITHPKLAVLDEANLLYELEQSKADIRKFLGDKYTFSAECPYGTENERVMEYAHKIYPALRNRMPEPYLDELNRSSRKQPGESDKEYVQWQRGPRTATTMDLMKSWVDTSISHNNIWLVLVFHGIEGIGYEPKPTAEIEEYFSYIKGKEAYLWIATFADVTKYMRERKSSTLKVESRKDSLSVSVSSDLDQGVYDVPLTLKTYVPGRWKNAMLIKASGKGKMIRLGIQKDAIGSFVMYDFIPGEGEIVLTKPNDN